MNNVFGVYGIEVNPRHLTLTSDYMTFTGAIKPFNRGAMADSASPLQKMVLIILLFFNVTINLKVKFSIELEFRNHFPTFHINVFKEICLTLNQS